MSVLSPERDTEGRIDAPPPERGKRRTRGARIALAIVALVTVWHIFASFLWIGPPTPLRQVVPGNLLTQYMIPWLGQSWSVFAPAPINGNYDLKIRAVLADKNGAEISTEWISAVGIEQKMLVHNLFPPRASNLAIKQASSLKGAWDALTPEQQKIAELNYFKGDDWLGRMQVAMNEANDKKNPMVVASYIVQERYTDAYAVQAARAVWGTSVVRVQYMTSRQNIIPFTERNNPDAKLPPLQFATTGWRGLIVMPGQSEEQFAEIFAPLHAKVSKK
ncbi:DUF5819 family protein [Leifsonia sp. NCR5]|uniref:DUF5819 family protein n=1 Tax=Leifsonia sp. NCR5 TaxID=1978342 RepID=UPI00211A53E5|nr:DUF5819 family protein [Leifsonia sp. NCR5]